MSEKLKIIILVIIGVLIGIGVGIIVLINTKGFKEKLINRELRAMTEEFYGYYYDDYSGELSVKENMAKFKDSGLSINLGDLKIYLESRTGKKYNSKRLEKCDVSKTRVIIYPKDPYGKKDIFLKFESSCK